MRSRIISAVLLLLILSPIIGNCVPHEQHGEKEVSFLSGLLSSVQNLNTSTGPQYVVAGLSTQSNWAWCHKCNGLFYFGAGQQNSMCPRDGLPHEAIGSANYMLPFLSNGQPTPSGYQDHWHWCNKCQAIWFDLSGAPNVCPNGGTHNSAGSGSYVLGTTSSPGSQQDQWRWCDQCGVLHYGPLVSQSMCPATHGNHSTAGSGNYYIDFQPNQVIPVNQMELALAVETSSGGYTGGLSAGGQILAQSMNPPPWSPLAYYSKSSGVQAIKIANAPDRGLSYMAYSKGNIIRFASAPRNQITTGNLPMTDLANSNITFSTFSSFGFVYFKGNFYLSYSSPQGGQSVYRSSDCINWTNVFAYGGAGNYNYSLSAVVTGAGSASEKIWLSYATPLPGYSVTIWTSTDGSSWNFSYYYYDNGSLASAQLAALSNGETILAFSRGGVGVVPIQYVTSTNGVFPNNTANTFPNGPASNIYREIDIATTGAGTIADVFLTHIDSGSNSTAYLRRYNLQNGTQLQSTTYTAPSGGIFQKPSVNLIPIF